MFQHTHLQALENRFEKESMLFLQVIDGLQKGKHAPIYNSGLPFPYVLAEMELIGQSAGLGLSLSYSFLKAHGSVHGSG